MAPPKEMKTVAVSFALKHGPRNKRARHSECAEQTPRPSSICGGCLWPHKLWKQVILSLKSMASRTALALQKDRTPRPCRHRNERLQRRLNSAWSPPWGVRRPSGGWGASRACVCGRMPGQSTWEAGGRPPQGAQQPRAAGVWRELVGVCLSFGHYRLWVLEGGLGPSALEPQPLYQAHSGRPGSQGSEVVMQVFLGVDSAWRYAHALISCEPDFIWKKNLF